MTKLATAAMKERASFNNGNQAGPGAIGGMQAGVSPSLVAGGARSNFGSVLGVKAPSRGSSNYNFGSPAGATAKGYDPRAGGKPIPIGPTGYRPGGPPPSAPTPQQAPKINSTGVTPGYTRRQNKNYEQAKQQMKTMDQQIDAANAGNPRFQQYGQATPQEDQEFLSELMNHNKKYNR